MNFLTQFEHETKNMKSSEAYFRWVGLSILATAVGRKVWIDFNDFQIYPNLFVLLVGSAAITNKSSAARYAEKLLQGVPKVNILPENMTAAAMLNKMSVNSTKTHVQMDMHNYAYGANLIYATEAVTVLGKSKWGNMLDILTELYDNNPNGWHLDKPWNKETLSGGVLNIFNPCINLLGCTTPETLLSKIISKQEIDSGFASRVFFVYEAKGSGKENTWKTEQEQARSNLIMDSLHRRLVEISKLIGPISVSEEVSARHIRFMNENENYIINLKNNKLKSFYGRKPTHILKIAMLLSISESNNMKIEIHHWNKAKEYLETLESKYKELFTGIGGSKYAAIIQVVWQYALKHDSFTISELNNVLWEDFDSTQIMSAVQTLVTMKRLILREDKRFVPTDKSSLNI